MNRDYPDHWTDRDAEYVRNRLERAVIRHEGRINEAMAEMVQPDPHGPMQHARTSAHDMASVMRRFQHHPKYQGYAEAMRVYGARVYPKSHEFGPPKRDR